MKTFIKNTVGLLILTAICVFVSCQKSGDDDPVIHEKGNGDWTGTISEYTLTVEDITTMIGNAIPSIGDYAKMLSSLLCDINVAKIKYLTAGPDGSLTEASGIVTYPVSTQRYNHILSIQHGTNDIDNGPSDQLFPIEAAPVFNGEVTVMADMLGYGISKTKDLRHTYLHAKTTGTACADMITAARQYLATKPALECTADSIRLIGYSQGGQATMATMFELQERGLAEDISLVWAGGGPYSLMEYLRLFIENPEKEFKQMGYIPYAFEGITNGDNISIDRTRIYAPYIFENGMDSIFTGNYLSDWHTILPHDITKVLNGNFFKPDYGNDPDVKAMIECLERNSLVNYTQSISDNIHIRFFHVPTDTYVPYTCSVLAARKWSSHCTLTDLTAGNHPAGGVEFILEYMGLQRFKFLLPLIDDVLN